MTVIGANELWERALSAQARIMHSGQPQKFDPTVRLSALAWGIPHRSNRLAPNGWLHPFPTFESKFQNIAAKEVLVQQNSYMNMVRKLTL